MISKILLIQEVFPNQERGTTFSSISLVLVEVNVQFPGLICLYILQDMCVTCQSVHRVILYILQVVKILVHLYQMHFLKYGLLIFWFW